MTPAQAPILKHVPAAPAPAPAPLLLTIRFSASLPDLDLDIPRPSATTIVSLKHLIRSRLDKTHARRRLRFIYGGKILPDTSVLTSVLRVPHPPPPPAPPSSISALSNGFPTNPDEDDDRSANATRRSKSNSNSKNNGKDKGKSVPGRPDPSPRIYVNCSIGDELSPSDLELEAAAAALPPPSRSSTALPTTGTNTTGTTTNTTTSTTSSTTTMPVPRGFERLLSAGFNASEVNQLRLQFRSIHASRYTPDTLPSPDSFRRLEDAWIDDNGAAVPLDATADGGMLGMGMGMGGGGGGGGGDEVGLVGMVDVLIRGVITGFIWPLGSAGWLIREEGMSSDRWRFMVGVGVIFSVLIGFIRAISGDK
ncbi:DUF2407 C-terminal domain-containing protein [Nemania serpens]|nr:DUF2407 C-terminal domain-containing protein [Nemania serpens]